MKLLKITSFSPSLSLYLGDIDGIDFNRTREKRTLIDASLISFGTFFTFSHFSFKGKNVYADFICSITVKDNHAHVERIGEQK